MDERTRLQLDADLARLAEGDRAAFDSVYRALWPAVRSLARRVLGDSPDAEDAAQEALVKVFARASDYDPGRPALAWALGIAAWECRSTLTRRRRSKVEATPAIDDAAGNSDPERLCTDREMLEALAAVMGTLRPADRESLEFALDEARCGPMTARLRKRKERALSRLREAWRRFYGVS